MKRLSGLFAASLLLIGCPEEPDPPLPDDDDSAAVDDDDTTEAPDDDDTTPPPDDDDVVDDDDSATGDDDDSAPQTIGDLCFPDLQSKPGEVAGPNYDQYEPTIGSHCFGTNHQDISGVERVVFVGDSVTVGVPNLLLDLEAFGFPAGAGTPTEAFYRNLLADLLADEFSLNDPGMAWRQVDILGGVSLEQSNGDFSSCAKWGARNDDILEPPNQQLETCMPEETRDLVTLIVMTSGGNDLASLTSNAIEGASAADMIAQSQEIVDYLEAAVAWVKTPGRFPNGVFLVYGNMYEFTDGTGDTSVCPAAELAGFGEPPPDPILLAEQVVWIQEQYMRIAVENGADMIWMLEHFCGHGWNSDNPDARCYLGPDTERWFDLSCTHPSEPGHAQIATMFMSVVQE